LIEQLLQPGHDDPLPFLLLGFEPLMKFFLDGPIGALVHDKVHQSGKPIPMLRHCRAPPSSVQSHKEVAIELPGI
jgi:hypothetical protein